MNVELVRMAFEWSFEEEGTIGIVLLPSSSYSSPYFYSGNIQLLTNVASVYFKVRFKKGVVIPIGPSGNSDEMTAYYGHPIYMDGWYWFYYSGYYYDPGPAADRCGIHLALSQDGVNFIKKGIVIPVGAVGDVDQIGCLYPAPVYKDGYIWIYYTARRVGGWDDIALAMSKDGLNFVKKGIVIPVAEIIDESDYNHAREPAPIWHDGYCWMFYTGVDFYLDSRICLALSKDGVNFIKKGVVVPLGSGDTEPSVFRDHGWWWMPSVWVDGVGTHRCVMNFSKDGFGWIRKGVILPVGYAGEVDADYTFGPSILPPAAGKGKGIDRHYRLYYSAAFIGDYRTALALSRDGLNYE